jgi:hypothetical protein
MDEALVEHIYNLGRILWSSALQVGQDPSQAKVMLRDRMFNPRPGDLVVEITSRRSSQAFDPDSVGRLLRTEGPSNSPSRWVVEPLLRPGEEQGWTNATFVAIPDEAREDRWSGFLDWLKENTAEPSEES